MIELELTPSRWNYWLRRFARERRAGRWIVGAPRVYLPWLRASLRTRDVECYSCEDSFVFDFLPC